VDGTTRPLMQVGIRRNSEDFITSLSCDPGRAIVVEGAICDVLFGVRSRFSMHKHRRDPYVCS